MKSKAGIFCIVLGILLLLGALLLFFYNMEEETEAQKAVMDVMPKLVQQIQENTAAEAAATPTEDTISYLELLIPSELLTEEAKEMTEVEIDGYMYIGYISIPALELDLPVMSTWSYPQLKIAPCRYNGSVLGEDFVVMAHNYYNHFGRISELQIGDIIQFTDMDGVTTQYEVVGNDILAPTAVDEMTSGEFDLTLFTCTYGGSSRITVYCNRMK